VLVGELLGGEKSSEFARVRFGRIVSKRVAFGEFASFA
jgi:hypothetical protein